MVRKYSILFGIIISAALLLVVASFYSEGLPSDKNSSDYDWKNNYPGNLSTNKAINRAGDPSGLWPLGEMFSLFSPLNISDKK